jgi:hypothetical protein
MRKEYKNVNKKVYGRCLVSRQDPDPECPGKQDPNPIPDPQQCYKHATVVNDLKCSKIKVS